MAKGRKKQSPKRRPRKRIPKRNPPRPSSSKREELSLEELKSIITRAKELGLEEDSLSKLDAAVDTLGLMTQELEAKGASIRRLRRLIFGPSSEKTSKVLGDSEKKDGDKTAIDDATGTTTDAAPSESSMEQASAVAESDQSSDDSDDTKKDKPKRKGHGRRGADDYTGAEKCTVDHSTLKHGDRCPECEKGKVYRQKTPKKLVRVTGVAPISATVYEMERLRCNLCGEVFTAEVPEGVGKERFDTKSAAMIALLKYGCGMPYNRLAKLQESLGIPLPASTQWELVQPSADKLMPVFTEFIRQAAQGKLLYNDDTVGRILKLEGIKTGPFVIDDDGIDKKRKGIFTTGIISVSGGHEIALFFTSRKHAGENLETVLKQRSDALDEPIQMSDGLGTNTAGDFETIESECNCHARRKYVEVANSFPDEVAFVLKKYRAVYKNDDVTKKQKMSDEERLAYHQEHSAPIMKDLKKWLNAQLDDRKVEPNSLLGGAINYTLKHWGELTQFLKLPGAPLDNNICERALKRAILHRKNALFYRTKNGAYIGDLFMSLIHTTELNDENPFDYLVALLENYRAVAMAPGLWMPWNFRQALESLHAE